MIVHLKYRTLGKLLRLAEKLKSERVGDHRPLKEQLAEVRQDTIEEASGTYEKVTPERLLHLFLESLTEAEKKEVIALFYFGRGAFDNFPYAIEHPPLSIERMPWELTNKTDLHDSIINGLKRLGDGPAIQ